MKIKTNELSQAQPSAIQPVSDTAEDVQGGQLQSLQQLDHQPSIQTKESLHPLPGRDDDLSDSTSLPTTQAQHHVPQGQGTSIGLQDSNVTELSFLIDLLLNEDLKKSTKAKLQQRIKIVESKLNSTTTTYAPSIWTPQPPTLRPIKDPTAQAPSTQAILSRDGPANHAGPIHTVPVVPVKLAAPTSMQAAQALQDRSALIRQAMNGKGAMAPKLGGPNR